MIKMTKNEFVKKAIIKHNNRYTYDLVEYINSNTKVRIICPEHGIFEQNPSSHINRGDGCKMCRDNYRRKLTFIEKSNRIHNNKYDYSLVEYRGVSNIVNIICSKHGIFEQTPNYHIRGMICNKCNNYGKKLNTLEFIKKANDVHKNRYDYSGVNYINGRTKVNILCRKHGVFEQTPNNHLSNHGCVKCNRSKGEIEIENYLIKNKYNYTEEFKFDDLRYKYPLRFDFAIFKNDELNCLIEFNGKQHYKYDEFMHSSEEYFLECLLKDNLKIDYCNKNNINLIIIKFNEDIIKKLKEYEL